MRHGNWPAGDPPRGARTRCGHDVAGADDRRRETIRQPGDRGIGYAGELCRGHVRASGFRHDLPGGDLCRSCLVGTIVLDCCESNGFADDEFQGSCRPGSCKLIGSETVSNRAHDLCPIESDWWGQVDMEPLVEGFRGTEETG